MTETLIPGAAIGDGEIGLDGFRLVLNDPRFVGLPMVLETPKSEDDAEDRRNLATLRALRPGGTYVALGGPVGWFLRSAIQSPALRLLTRESMGMMLWWKPFYGPDVETLKAMTDSGSLKPRIDRRFRLDDVVEALRYVDAGSARGKVIVTP